MSQIQVPKGWETAKLGDKIQLVMGQAPPGSSYNHDGIGTIFVKVGEFGNLYPRKEVWTTKPQKLAKVSDVLLCVVGATTGKTNLGIDCAIGRSVAALRPLSSQIMQKYLFYFLRMKMSEIRNSQQGSAQGVINKSNINNMIIPLPKISIQKKIIQKLDYILEQLEEKNKAILEYVKKNNNSINYIISNYHRMIISSQIPNKNLPKTWKIKKLNDIATIGQGGTPSRIRPEYWYGDIPWLRSGELLDNRIYDSNEKITKLGLQKSSTQLCPKRTILIAMTGQGLTRGRTGFLEINACANQSCTHIIIKDDDVLNEYVWLYLQSQYWNFRKIHHGSGQPGINTSLIKQLDVLIPPLSEQKKIINEIKALESDAKIIKTNLRSILEKNNAIISSLNNLRNSVLVHAFSGRLVN